MRQKPTVGEVSSYVQIATVVGGILGGWLLHEFRPEIELGTALAVGGIAGGLLGLLYAPVAVLLSRLRPGATDIRRLHQIRSAILSLAIADFLDEDRVIQRVGVRHSARIRPPIPTVYDADGNRLGDAVDPLTADMTVVIGASGVGKSHRMWTWATDVTRRCLADDIKPVPFMTEASQWTSTDSFESFLARQLAVRGLTVSRSELRTVLRAGLIDVIVDGIDELDGFDRERLTAAILRYVADGSIAAAVRVTATPDAVGDLLHGHRSPGEDRSVLILELVAAPQDRGSALARAGSAHASPVVEAGTPLRQILHRSIQADGGQPVERGSQSELIEQYLQGRLQSLRSPRRSRAAQKALLFADIMRKERSSRVYLSDLRVVNLAGRPRRLASALLASFIFGFLMLIAWPAPSLSALMWSNGPLEGSPLWHVVQVVAIAGAAATLAVLLCRHELAPVARPAWSLEAWNDSWDESVERNLEFMEESVARKRVRGPLGMLIAFLITVVFTRLTSVADAWQLTRSTRGATWSPLAPMRRSLAVGLLAAPVLAVLPAAGQALRKLSYPALATALATFVLTFWISAIRSLFTGSEEMFVGYTIYLNALVYAFALSLLLSLGYYVVISGLGAYLSFRCAHAALVSHRLMSLRSSSFVTLPADGVLFRRGSGWSFLHSSVIDVIDSAFPARMTSLPDPPAAARRTGAFW